ncbi:phosphoserine phosphatase [Marinomonas sp. SBI22]|uniref:histidinol-phosphatase n=1 Tax=unclassified Marinomonas TaxID=196814 RepID=UPI0007AEF70D|nr:MULTISPECIES: HAD family hydrolase [unclassified Marinomonas]KZM42942.1 phosphoserine phosphatase [Marinomonas sp. SBI22]KZM44512.1 phosphoserine phosphatase [Marinomonas sp. SBI8L]
MTLAIFDLDGTLLSGDSDYNWGQFLVEEGIVDADTYKTANDKFYQDYLSGGLDIHEYLAFSLAPLTQFNQAQLEDLHNAFMAKKIMPMMQEKALKLVQEHKEKGHFLMIITATNEFVTGPISQYFGMDHLIAPMPEIIEDRYTGKVTGIPSFQEGKVTRLNAWLKETGHTLEGSYFYSDSHNDLPLLELVSQPIVVDGDDKLSQLAEQRNWQHISLRD